MNCQKWKAFVRLGKNRLAPAVRNDDEFGVDCAPVTGGNQNATLAPALLAGPGEAQRSLNELNDTKTPFCFQLAGHEPEGEKMTARVNQTVKSENRPLYDGFVNTTNFFFSTPVAVTAGTTYYSEPVVQSGDLWDAIYYHYNYPYGSAYVRGVPNIWDLWFQEGVVVPEPSSALLISIGAGGLVYARRRHIANHRD